MISFSRTIALVGLVGGLANAGNLPRSKKCSTLHSGYVVITVGTDGVLEALRKNSTQGDINFATGDYFKVHYQSCASLGTSTNFDYLGRLVIEGDDAPDGNHKCVTIDNSSNESQPWFAKAEECTSDTRPSAAQTFGYGTNFNSQFMYWAKNSTCSAGILEDSGQSPVTDASHRIQITCAANAEYLPFRIGSKTFEQT